MLWQIHRLKARLGKRRSMQLCRRCGLLFQANLSRCPHCSNIGDDQLTSLLEQRARSRKSLGKSLIYASIVIAVLLVVANI